MAKKKARHLRICYDKKLYMWYAIEKQLLPDMRFHKIIVFKHKKRCEVINFIEAQDDV